MAKKKNVVVLTSGGFDSYVLYHYYKKAGYEVKPLFVYFNSKANQEEQKLCRRLYGDDLAEADLKIEKSKEETWKNFSELNGEDSDAKLTSYPNRNLILLSYASNYAVANGYSHIAIASIATDGAYCPDNRYTFIRKMKQAISYGSGSLVDLKTPFRNYTKKKVGQIGRSLGLNLIQDTYSCFEGTEKHCGKCDGCIEKLSVLDNLGYLFEDAPELKTVKETFETLDTYYELKNSGKLDKLAKIKEAKTKGESYGE
jgi:7-cyano-7-deazaguanine synthase